MAQKSQTLSPGDHWNSFIENHLAQDRYASASELVGAGLTLLEEQEEKLTSLRETLENACCACFGSVMELP